MKIPWNHTAWGDFSHLHTPRNHIGYIFPIELIWMGDSHLWTPELCQSGHELFPWMTLLHLCCSWPFQSVSGKSEGKRHISSIFFLYLDTLEFFPNLLCQMWENLFTPRKGFWESPERFNSLVIKSGSSLQSGWVQAHGQMGPGLLIRSLGLLAWTETTSQAWKKFLTNADLVPWRRTFRPNFHFNC